MIPRPDAVEAVSDGLRRSRAVALIGPRQCGKTTLARQFVPVGSANYFDLEDPVSLARLAEPMTALLPLRGIVVLDEIQQRPDLFAVLRVLLDRDPLPSRFLLLGSASPRLMRHTSESLAGRLQVIELAPFGMSEVGVGDLNRHWLRGGLPPSYLAETDQDSAHWRAGLVRTLVERDIPRTATSLSWATLHRLWAMIAHMHGGIWSPSDPARSLGISQTAVRRYLDFFTGLYMVRQLQPWFENLGKRQVKSPKVYIRDSGVLHTLMGIGNLDQLLLHPRCGASWEGYIIEECIKATRCEEAYYWATHQGAELDLLLFRGGRRYGIEVKREDAPRMTKSMRVAMEDLKLDRLVVLYPGTTAYPAGDGVYVTPVTEIAGGLPALFAA